MAGGSRRGMGHARRHVPPAFIWYWHAGFRERWNRPGYGDPAMVRTFDEYLADAMAEGWWATLEPNGRGLPSPGADRVRRQHRAAHPRRARHRARAPVAEPRPGGHRRRADVQHRAVVRHRAARGPALREGRHPHPLFTHHDLLDEAVPPVGRGPAGVGDLRHSGRALARRAAARGVESFTDRPASSSASPTCRTGSPSGAPSRPTSRSIDEIVRDTAYAGLLAPDTDLNAPARTGHPLHRRGAAPSWARPRPPTGPKRGRDRQPVLEPRRRRRALSDAHPSGPVPHRASLVRRGRRGSPGAQGPARHGRRPPLP